MDPMMVRALNQRQNQAPMRFFEAGTHGQDMGDDDLPPAVTPPDMQMAEFMHLDPDEVDFEPTVTSSADTVTYGDGRDSRDWAPGEGGDLNRDVDRERDRYLEDEDRYYTKLEQHMDEETRTRFRNERRKGFVDLQAETFFEEGTHGMWTGNMADALSNVDWSGVGMWAGGAIGGIAGTNIFRDRRDKANQAEILQAQKDVRDDHVMWPVDAPIDRSVEKTTINQVTRALGKRAEKVGWPFKRPSG
tara:strand:- start:770 stop:1507 length:738 start_codon:yes stop_codon:yes gene_type:complete